MKRRGSPALLGRMVFVGLAACGDSTSSNVLRPASLTVIPSEATLDAIGATLPLEATVRDALGNPLSDVTVTYGSSNPDVVAVSGAGIVTAVGAGTTTVNVSADSLTRESVVTVAQVPAQTAIVSGLGQSAVVTNALAQPFVVEIRDRLDNPIGGATVQFTLGLSPGALSATSVTTGPDGRASTVLTLDTLAGSVYSVTATVTSGRADPVTFTATGLPDVAAVAGAHAGDQQNQPIATTLPDDVVVRVTDQYGNGVPGATVAFAVTSGGGSVAPASATSDANGDAVARWTLGATLGAQTLNATVTGLTGGTVTFAAAGTDLAISSITPTVLVEGGTATITGTGFDPVAANNTVTVDGRVASISASTTSSIDFVVPTPACRPAQALDVVVSTVQSGTTPPTSHPSQPASPVALAVGEQLIVQDPDDFCLQFLATAPDEHYLLGIQSTTIVTSALTDGRVIAAVPPGTPAPPAPVISPRAPSPHRLVASDTPRRRRWRAHRQAEVHRWSRQLERMVPGRTAPSAAAARESAIDSTVQVGQSVTLKVPRLDGDLCDDFDTVTMTVKAVGAHGIWLHDAANPPGFTNQDYLDLSDLLDRSIYTTSVSYFGQPTDLDGNNRVLIAITKNVNEQSPAVLGFVNTSDVSSPSTCAGSNQAEVFYGRAPDETGTLGFVYRRAAALEDAPPLIAHELTHIIQIGRRLVINSAPFMSIFMAEGQANFGEEVVGHAVLGNTAGQNYGYATALNDPQNAASFWYASGMWDLAAYFGYDPSNPNTSVSGAPARCGWMRRDPTPCTGRPLWYGVTWSLLRWSSDQYGSQFAGGESDIHQALINSSLSGLANLEQVVGVDRDSLLAQWGAALYVDDRVPGADPRITMPSWDFVGIFDTGLPSSADLVPSTIPFGAQNVTFTVRAGSTAYYRIQGSNRPDVAFRVVDPADQALPFTTQIFLVRIQ